MCDTPHTKAWFMSEMQKSLAGLPSEYIREVLSDFEEHFDAGILNGESEDEICVRLGDPKIIGEQLRQEAVQSGADVTEPSETPPLTAQPRPSTPPLISGQTPRQGPPPFTNQGPPPPPPPIRTASSANGSRSGGCLRQLVMFCVLAFFNLVVVLGPWIGVAAVLFSMWFVAIALILSGILCIAAGIIAPMMVFDWITLYTPLSYFNAIMAGIALISGGILLFYAITLLNKGFYKLTARYLHWNCKAMG
ncbi:DUF1700 domain-containing protein [Bianquea renquensis]|uniref:DUF1700 domain-containing protein n=1 Tax=Bianquea renquensis TaxID=2763661 RepID=A0A926DSS8_9FIRM|nr:DUF1700 domain-containing protein [Bianquea renquensis]MBC8543147.1 DUF1700 domain-containing protein [Bianquea renquensis]